VYEAGLALKDCKGMVEDIVIILPVPSHPFSDSINKLAQTQ